jgi:hypothetical protein
MHAQKQRITFGFGGSFNFFLFVLDNVLQVDLM